MLDVSGADRRWSRVSIPVALLGLQRCREDQSRLSAQKLLPSPPPKAWTGYSRRLNRTSQLSARISVQMKWQSRKTLDGRVASRLPGCYLPYLLRSRGVLVDIGLPRMSKSVPGTEQGARKAKRRCDAPSKNRSHRFVRQRQATLLRSPC